MSEFAARSTDELRDHMDEIAHMSEQPDPAQDFEALETEYRAISAELEARRSAAREAQEQRDAAAQNGETIRKFEEEKPMAFTMPGIETPEYRSLYIRGLQNRLTEEERAVYDSSNTNAVPTLIADKFINKLKKLAPMVNEITLMRVAGNLKFVVEGVRNAASKHTENSDQSASEDTTVGVTLGGYEFMKIIKISRTARLMSIDAFEAWLVDNLADDIYRKIDDYILNDATNGIAAITYTTGTNQILNAATTGYTYDDICDVIALLPAAYDADAAFVTNKRTLYNHIAKIKDGNGNPIFVPDTITGVGGHLMGFRLLVDDYVTTANGALYLGNWRDVVGNMSEDINVESDESAGFTSNSVVYRGLAVFDSKPAKTDAIVRLVTTA